VEGRGPFMRSGGWRCDPDHVMELLSFVAMERPRASMQSGAAREVKVWRAIRAFDFGPVRGQYGPAWWREKGRRYRDEERDQSGTETYAAVRLQIENGWRRADFLRAASG